ncbi:MAG: hypothetical protein GT597_13885 [Bacteroidales bacterium]|jgi:hypothetical protein|nr:hypothetical protein [Bacteroidales bacterium]
MKEKYVRVKFIKAAYGYAYSAGDTGIVEADKAPALIREGCIQVLPDEDDELDNTLPEDLPGRDKLFKAGFKEIGEIREAGESLTDILTKKELKDLGGYLEAQKSSE